VLIPRVIHSIWLGDKPLPRAFRRYQRTWLAHHPRWELRLWTESNLPPDLIRKEIYETLRVPAERSDMLRLEVLQRHGGLYVDTDLECLRPFDDLVGDLDFFVGELRPGRIQTACIGSVAGHPILTDAIREIQPRTFNGLDKEATGPIFFDRIVRRHAGVKIFPPPVLYPSSPGEEETAYARHWNARSWHDAEALAKDLALAEDRFRHAQKQLYDVQKSLLRMSAMKTLERMQEEAERLRGRIVVDAAIAGSSPVRRLWRRSKKSGLQATVRRQVTRLAPTRLLTTLFPPVPPASTSERRAGRGDRRRKKVDTAIESPAVLNGGATDRTPADLVPVNQPLILISQVQRSGGTLLGRLFDGHPECFAHPYELRWRRPAAGWPAIDLNDSPEDIFTQLDERWVAKFAGRGFYKKDPAHKHDDAHPFVFDRALERRLFLEGFAARRPTRQREALDLHFTALFNAWLDYKGREQKPKRFITAFTLRLNSNAGGLEDFWTDYPDGYLVSIIREPVSWFASLKGLGDKCEWSSPTELAVRAWKRSFDSSLAAQERWPDRVIVIFFEDLLKRTEHVMRRICDRTGLPFDERLLTPTYNGRPILSDSSFAPKQGVDPSAADRASRVSPVDAAIIRTAVGDAYAQAREQFAG